MYASDLLHWDLRANTCGLSADGRESEPRPMRCRENFPKTRCVDNPSWIDGLESNLVVMAPEVAFRKYRKVFSPHKLASSDLTAL